MVASPSDVPQERVIVRDVGLGRRLRWSYRPSTRSRADNSHASRTYVATSGSTPPVKFAGVYLVDTASEYRVTPWEQHSSVQRITTSGRPTVAVGDSYEMKVLHRQPPGKAMGGRPCFLLPKTAVAGLQREARLGADLTLRALAPLQHDAARPPTSRATQVKICSAT